MKENKVQEGFEKCPRCGSELCYSQTIGEDFTKMCISCGFTTTSMMKDGSETEKSVSDKQPKFYKDALKYVDEEGYVWYPAVMTVPEKGMIYADVTGEDDWQWAFTPFRELTVEEKQLAKYKGLKYIADAANTEHYGKGGFAEAAMKAGIFDE